MGKPIINTLDNNFAELSNRAKNYSGMQFNNWKVLGYKGNQCWLCQCQCENKTLKILRAYDFISGSSRSCGCTRHEDLTGKQFGNWKVLKYDCDSHWICECQCENHTVKSIKTAYLKNGVSKSCGCLQRISAAEHMKNIAVSRTEDITGLQIGYWKAVEYVSGSEWIWECTICGNRVQARKRGIRVSRRCNKHELPLGIDDLTGKRINNWLIIKYAGNKSWLCECQCENHTRKIVKAQRLKSGDSKSCGCMRGYYFLKSYNYSDEQIDILRNKDRILKIINDNSNENGKITLYNLSEKLGVNYQLAIRIVKRHELSDYIDYNYNNSHFEVEIFEWIKNELHIDAEQSNRTQLNGYELDIWIASKRIAIEFNGSYWHSDIHKDKYYHQDKTIKCARNNIRLIHIFEHEWVDIEKQYKIKELLRNILTDTDISTIYARKTHIKDIDNDEYRRFVGKYHLQGYTASKIRIGCYYEDELIGVLGIGKPRFSTDYDYEVIRMCWKSNIRVIGGTNKLFRYFIDNYKPDSIITYSDISKFTGNSYLKCGFQVIKNNSITEPNYVWVSRDLSTILTRYQTQKSKLIEQGLGTINQTEDEIMHQNDFMKIYDCGNIRLEWRKDKDVNS